MFNELACERSQDNPLPADLYLAEVNKLPLSNIEILVNFDARRGHKEICKLHSSRCES